MAIGDLRETTFMFVRPSASNPVSIPSEIRHIYSRSFAHPSLTYSTDTRGCEWKKKRRLAKTRGMAFGRCLRSSAQPVFGAYRCFPPPLPLFHFIYSLLSCTVLESVSFIYCFASFREDGTASYTFRRANCTAVGQTYL